MNKTIDTIAAQYDEIDRLNGINGALLEACLYTLNNLEAAEREKLITAPRHFRAQLGESVKMLRAAVEKAAEVTP